MLFQCKASGKRKIAYQWLKDGVPLSREKSSNLVFDQVKPRDFGCYSCEVRCSDGQNKSKTLKLSHEAKLDVLPREGMSKYTWTWFLSLFLHSDAPYSRMVEILLSFYIDVKDLPQSMPTDVHWAAVKRRLESSNRDLKQPRRRAEWTAIGSVLTKPATSAHVSNFVHMAFRAFAVLR